MVLITLSKKGELISIEPMNYSITIYYETPYSSRTRVKTVCYTENWQTVTLFYDYASGFITDISYYGKGKNRIKEGEVREINIKVI